MTTNSKVIPFDVQTPREGYFEMREVKSGPLVAVRFWLEDGDREMCGGCMGVGDGDGLYGQCEYCGGVGSFLMSDDIWHCEVNGQERDPWQVWLWASKNEITKDDHDYRVARSAFDQRRRGLDPKKPIDLNEVNSIF